MDAVSLALVALVAALVGLLLAGVGESARRAELPKSRRRGLVAGVAVGLLGWLALTAALAHSGVLAVWTSRPPRLLMLPMTAFVVLLVLTRTVSFRALLAGVPPSWLVALQSFRIGVELALWGLYTRGAIPIQMTFEGRNFDVLVGIGAPAVAYLVATGRIGARGLMYWHLFGLGMLVNVVGIAATSIPGPLHLAWPGAPLTAVATWPMVWIPAFLAPLAVFLHVASIRQMAAWTAPPARKEST